MKIGHLYKTQIQLYSFQHPHVTYRTRYHGLTQSKLPIKMTGNKRNCKNQANIT